MRLSSLVILIFLLVGCSAAPQLPVQAVTTTNQSAAPALWVDSDKVTTAWIAQDSAGIRHQARTLRSGEWSDPITLPLPPVRPYDQQLIPASEGAIHLFWLDQDPEGMLHLYAALLGPDLSVERGPQAISESLALRYTALPHANGSALLLWNGGVIAEPTLYAQHVSVRGLVVGNAIPIAYGADWPTAIRANDGAIHLFWLDTDSRTPRYGRLDGTQVSDIETIDGTFQLSSGDRLQSLAAALDQGYLYLFWNITRRSGQAESGMAAHPLAGGEWMQVYQLGLAVLENGESPQTGFNTVGAVQAATPGQTWLRWIAPLPGQFETLPVAAQVEGQIALVFLRSGAIIGYQPLVPADGLLRPPSLRTDRDRNLYLTWANSQADGPAALNLLTTRP